MPALREIVQANKNAARETAGQLRAPFGIADSYDEAAKTYIDLTLDKHASVRFDGDMLMVRREVADSATGRFVKPGIAKDETPARDDSKKDDHSGDGGNGDGTGLNLDPLLIALLKKIPPTEEGWPGPKRVRWFKTFAMNVSQIYDANEDDPVEISIKLERGSETGNG
ncbi:MAG: hypothetical protein ACREHF_13860 [Rhizomicrobium sp.]